MKPIIILWAMSLLLLFSMNGKSYAQSEDLYFENLSAQQGLPKTSINSILQDREGFMWFGTEDGLYKYDGHRATAYQADPANPNHTLRSNNIRAIHEDQKGRLWIGTYGGGLHQVDKWTGKVIAYPINSVQGNGWNSLYSSTIVEDAEGILWLGSSLGIARFDPTTEKYSLYPSPNGQIIYSLKEDEHGILWAANQEGIYRFDPTTGKFTTLFPVTTPAFSNYVDKKGNAWMGTYGEGLFRMDTRTTDQFTPYNPGGLIKNIIVYIYEADGLWLATSEGLQHIDLSTDQVTTYQSDPSGPGSLSSNIIWSVYKDHTGNLWVGTSNGVNKASTRTKPFYTHQIIPTPSSFHRPENEITSVLEDHTGTVWVGSAAKGLYRLDAQTHQLTHVVVNPNDKGTMLFNQEWPLVEDTLGQLWVGTDMEKGLYRLDRATGKFIRYPCESFVRMLDVDALGKLWIGGFVNEMASFDPATEQFTYYKASEKDSTSLIPGMVNDLMVSHTGEVWVATTSGMSRLNPKTGKFTRYQPNSKAPKGHLNDHYVLSLYEDKEGIIWIGTFQGGLNRFDPKSNTFAYFTTQHGLPSNRVESIIGDEKGNLWIGTSQGLSRFTPATNTFRNFSVSDGLPGNQFLGGVFSRNGKLFFGNMDGLVSFYPDSIQGNTTIPPVYITGFKVLEQSRFLPTDKVELPYDENFLSFDFVALNYNASEKNQYAYKLEGVDKDWVYSGNRRFASYTDLDPGKYKFYVKGSNNDGVWNEQGASIQVTILPPFWQTWWAYSLYGLLGISILYGLIYYSVSRERLKSDLKLQRLEAEKMHEIDHMKSRFFANISHEFRTPLTLILGPVQSMLMHVVDAEQVRKNHQMIYVNAQRLLELINQLLDLSKLEAGSMKLEPKPADIVSFLKATVLSFTSLAERRHIQYHVQYPTEHPIVYFDADKLEKIIINLLSNAFKFTPAGGETTVTARVRPAEERSIPTSFRKAGSSSSIKILELKVQDSGTGIAEHQKEKIFDRFYQVDTSHTREQEGTGIGLSLVKELVELYEGEISVESQPEKGSCFTVRLPLLVADYEQITVGESALHSGQNSITSTSATVDEMSESAEAMIARAGTDAPLVLIVEDNADIRQFIRQHLYPTYQVIEACDGAEGYAIALETIPDLILSDVMMPVMDGVELCRKLKTNEKTAHVPVILLTAKASGGDKIEGLQTGADDYIIKPFQADELLVRIKNLIDSRKKLRERFSREITLEPASVAITSVDEQFLQKVMKIIEAHMDDAAFGVEAFGLEAGMSRMQLFRKLKALTNYSPADFIRLMRLRRAAELFSQEAGNIAEVAFQVGFQDPSYFTKCFQKQFGKTPSEYLAGQAPAAKS